MASIARPNFLHGHWSVDGGRPCERIKPSTCTSEQLRRWQRNIISVLDHECDRVMNNDLPLLPQKFWHREGRNKA